MSMKIPKKSKRSFDFGKEGKTKARHILKEKLVHKLEVIVPISKHREELKWRREAKHF